MSISSNPSLLVCGCPSEEWRPIRGYEVIYEISDRGRVRRVATGHTTYAGRILKPGINSHGCPQVALYCRGVRTTHLVSHLVADAFLQAKCPTDRVLRHLNDDPADNRIENLAWGTYSDNAYDAMRNEKWHPSRGSTNGQAKLTEDDVREIRRLYATGNFTQRELALEFGIARSAIGKIVRRQAWKHVV